MRVQDQSLISPPEWCDSRLPSWRHESEEKNQAIPAIRRGQSFQQMDRKGEHINGDMKRDSIWKIRKCNRILMGYVNIPTYYHLERRMLNNIKLAILKQGRLRGPGPGAPPPAWEIQENTCQLVEL